MHVDTELRHTNPNKNPGSAAGADCQEFVHGVVAALVVIFETIEGDIEFEPVPSDYALYLDRFWHQPFLDQSMEI
jgi:hypothetical protein